MEAKKGQNWGNWCNPPLPDTRPPHTQETGSQGAEAAAFIGDHAMGWRVSLKGHTLDLEVTIS